MKTTEVPIILRITLLIGLIFLGNILLYWIYVTAPHSSLQWLKSNAYFNLLIILTFNLSLIFAEMAILFPKAERQESK